MNLSEPSKLGPSAKVFHVAIVEDHLLQRKGTQALVDSHPRLDVVYSGETLPDFLAWLRTSSREQRPQLLVLDLMAERRPSVDPVAVRALVSAGLRIVVLSALSSPPLVQHVIRAGVAGVVSKRDAEADVLTAILTVLRGGEWMTTELSSVLPSELDRPRLSHQEERTLVLYVSGLTLGQVAAAIGVKRDTAKQYLDRVKSKYGAVGRPARTKLELSRIAVADGYLDPHAT